MSRPRVTPRKVEALARECLDLKQWLRGEGSGADSHAYAVAVRSYNALLTAVAMLPHGMRYLSKLGVLPPPRRAPPKPLERTATSFTMDELVMLDEPVLTPDGWVVPAPLVPHVDAMLEQIRSEGDPLVATDKEALRRIIVAWANQRGKSAAQSVTDNLQKLQTRLSRARAGLANRPPITDALGKMPPQDDCE